MTTYMTPQEVSAFTTKYPETLDSLPPQLRTVITQVILAKQHTGNAAPAQVGAANYQNSHTNTPLQGRAYSLNTAPEAQGGKKEKKVKRCEKMQP